MLVSRVRELLGQLLVAPYRLLVRRAMQVSPQAADDNLACSALQHRIEALLNSKRAQDKTAGRSASLAAIPVATASTHAAVAN